MRNTRQYMLYFRRVGQLPQTVSTDGRRFLIVYQQNKNNQEWVIKHEGKLTVVIDRQIKKLLKLKLKKGKKYFKEHWQYNPLFSWRRL